MQLNRVENKDKGDGKMVYAILVIGFLLLIKGADFFVDGASSIAKIFKVPSMLIGLTIVAFGTSAPEAAVSINAALTNNMEISVGNIIGSNIFNLLLIIGLSGIMKPIPIQRKTIIKEFPFLILTSLVLYILSADVTFQQIKVNMLSRGDGLILLALFSIFTYYLVEMATLSKETSEESNIKPMPLGKSILLGILGLAGILIGAKLVVSSSSTIAMKLGMSQTLIGLTIVAIGTSLPELVTSVVAAHKGESDIAIGNVVGSNIFNVLVILGITIIIRPIPVEGKIFFDMLYLLGGTLLTFIFVATGRRVSRLEGLLMVITYVVYMGYIIIRN